MAQMRANAQSYPAKSVRIVVGFTPGGVTDVTARILAQKLTELWGQTVVVDNRPGASGIIGAEAVSKAPPDGYTLLVAPQTSTSVATTLYPKLPYRRRARHSDHHRARLVAAAARAASVAAAALV